MPAKIKNQWSSIYKTTGHLSSMPAIYTVCGNCDFADYGYPMTTSEPFQRARRPEQKEERRAHLLATARSALRGGMELSDLGLNELARQAHMTKSNVYRYFENREALLLALLEEESALWRSDLDERLGALSQPTAPQLAQAFAGASAAYPLMCRLLSILPSIIEHNVSPERLRTFKLNTVALVGDLARQLHGRMPSISIEGYIVFVRQAMVLTIGLWPLSHPRDALAQVMALPELLPLRYDFEADLAAGLQLLLRGLAPMSPAAMNRKTKIL
ncbi:TetR/AcrR family transcriptional regulator [Duganella radicis]|nr:TetR/AcrR family transcriptional regulator [Duganella radicis]